MASADYGMSASLLLYWPTMPSVIQLHHTNSRKWRGFIWPNGGFICFQMDSGTPILQEMIRHVYMFSRDKRLLKLSVCHCSDSSCEQFLNLARPKHTSSLCVVETLLFLKRLTRRKPSWASSPERDSFGVWRTMQTKEISKNRSHFTLDLRQLDSLQWTRNSFVYFNIRVY